MKKARIISITGDLGSGKSTVSDILKKKLNYDYVYTGKIQREIACRYNMTTLELNRYAETHREIDEEIDATFKSLNDSANLVVDSRLAWFFVHSSFKVFLKTGVMVAARRISGDMRRKSERYTSVEEAVKNIIARKTSENKRYMELYAADCSDFSNFNLIVDCSFITPDRVADIIIDGYHAWLDDCVPARSYVSPLNLYPTQSIQRLSGGEFKTVQDSMRMSGYDSNSSVEAVSSNSFDYIIDGHKRVAAAIENGIELIPVTFRNEVLGSIEPGLFQDWEEFNSFRYLMYPELGGDVKSALL